MLLNSFKNLRFWYWPKSVGILHSAPGCVWTVWLAVIQGRLRCAPDPTLFNCQEGAEDGVAILLLGNKTDCAAERQVPMEQGERLAKVGAWPC